MQAVDTGSFVSPGLRMTKFCEIPGCVLPYIHQMGERP
jgi:hypothetical protein